MWGYFGAGRLGALLGHLWRHSVFLTPTNVDKVLQKWPQGFKIDPKSIPQEVPCPQNASKLYKILQKGFQHTSSTEQQGRQWPGGLREAFKLILLLIVSNINWVLLIICYQCSIRLILIQSILINFDYFELILMNII